MAWCLHALSLYGYTATPVQPQHPPPSAKHVQPVQPKHPPPSVNGQPEWSYMPCTPRAPPRQPKVPPPLRMQAPQLRDEDDPMGELYQKMSDELKDEDFSDDYDYDQCAYKSNLPSSMEGVAPAVKWEQPLTPPDKEGVAPAVKWDETLEEEPLEEEPMDEDPLTIAVKKSAEVQFQTS